jgi:RNA ligase (TIGR02306 family)
VTYVYDAKMGFIVCSRNYVIQLNKSTIHYFNVCTSFDIEKKMTQYGKSIAIQGEIVGPSINGNKLKLNKLDFRVFNIYDIENQTYISTTDIIQFCNDYKLNTVPILYLGPNNETVQSVQNLLSYTETVEYDKNVPAEGIVVRTNTCSPRTSFKVISNKYLLKHKL